MVPATPPQAYCPGNEYVDWIASDGYDFQTIFAEWYTWASAMPKPLMVAEYGVLDDPAIPGRKAAWYDEMSTTLQTTMPLIQGVVAWSTTNTKQGIVYNWNVDSSPSALAAWTVMGNDPYFDPNGPQTPPLPALNRLFESIRGRCRVTEAPVAASADTVPVLHGYRIVRDGVIDSGGDRLPLATRIG